MAEETRKCISSSRQSPSTEWHGGQVCSAGPALRTVQAHPRARELGLLPTARVALCVGSSLSEKEGEKLQAGKGEAPKPRAHSQAVHLPLCVCKLPGHRHKHMAIFEINPQSDTHFSPQDRVASATAEPTSASEAMQTFWCCHISFL